MKAVLVRAYGGSDVLRIEDVPMPDPKPNQVLIRVHAAGINPSDWHLRKGDMKLLAPKLPIIPGSECAGVVQAVGELVTDVRPGDRVVALLGHGGGGYAQYVVADAKRVVVLPGGVSFVEGAALPVAGITALQSLRDLGHTRPGDSVLINGAAGGVGTMGVQIGRLLGATVTAVCRAANADLVRRLGAHEVIDYQTVDFTRQPERYQVVFDAVNASSFDACRRVLLPAGIYISTRPSARLFWQVLLTQFRSQKARFIGAKDRASDVAWLLTQLQQRQLEVVIDRTYPLNEVAQAHDYSETGRVRGKLVLLVE